MKLINMKSRMTSGNNTSCKLLAEVTDIPYGQIPIRIKWIAFIFYDQSYFIAKVYSAVHLGNLLMSKLKTIG